MTIFAVEWNPVDDHFIMALSADLKQVRAIYDAFVPDEEMFGWLSLNEYETDVLMPMDLPKQIAERYIE